MIDVVCDPGSRYTKIVAARPGREHPVCRQFASHEADDLGRLAREVAKTLRPGFFEPVRIWVVGDGWVPKRTASRPVMLGAALASVVTDLGETALVADCGGLRTRVFDISKGVLKRSLENERCTSGGGRFVETMTAALESDMDKVDELVSAASSPVRISSPCMVFAESEMISQVNAGVPKQDVLAGVVAHAVEKAATLIMQADPSGRPVVIGGGLARLAAFRQGLAAALPGIRIVRPDVDPMFFNGLTGLASVSDAFMIGWSDTGNGYGDVCDGG